MSYTDETDMSELVGRTVSRIWIGPGEHTLVVETDQGRLAWDAVGDCCSECWFAELIGVDALLGETVTAVRELEMRDAADGKSRQEEDQIYGIALTTRKGVVTVVFRNSSNGYYGGWITPIKPPRIPKYREITKEWSA